MMCGFSSTLEDNSAPEAGFVSIRTSAATGSDDTREARTIRMNSRASDMIVQRNDTKLWLAKSNEAATRARRKGKLFDS